MGIFHPRKEMKISMAWKMGWFPIGKRPKRARDFIVH